MKLLLTGDPHSGKSTLLSKIISHIEKKQGFITQEVLKNGERVGFELVSSLNMRVKFATVESSSEVRVSRYGLDIETLDNFLQDLPAINRDSLLYIDEIGQMQLHSEIFRSLVKDYLEAPNYFIGTISKVYKDEFIKAIVDNNEVEIIKITPQNRNQLESKIVTKLATKGYRVF